MNFNEGKCPMYIFGVDINKLYEDVKLFQNLPEFCDNLKQKTEIINMIKVNKSSETKIDDLNSGSNKNKKIIKKIKIPKLFLRISNKSEKKTKESGKLKLDPIFKNNNLSDILPSISCSSQVTDNTNITNQKAFHNKSMKKILFKNALINTSIQNKNISETSVFNRLSAVKINQKKNIIKKINTRQYTKKWNLPKVVKFGLLTGRGGENTKKSFKFKYIDEAKQIYSPNYNYIYANNSYNFVNYSPGCKNDFNKMKFSIARKAICNYERMRNCSSDSLFVLDAMKNAKKKKREMRIKKLKEKYEGLFDFLNFDKNKHKFNLSLINKNVDVIY